MNDLSNISFCCSHCGKAVSAASGAAGRQAKCPGCGQLVTVPMKSPSAKPPPLPTALRDEVATAESRAADRSTDERCYFCGVNVPDPAAKFQRIPRCAQCKTYQRTKDRIRIVGTLLWVILGTLVLFAAVVAGIMIWGPDENRGGIWFTAILGVIAGSCMLYEIGSGLSSAKAEKAVPYKMRTIEAARKKYEANLTLELLLDDLAPRQHFSTVGVAYWDSIGIRARKMLFGGVLGHILMGGEHRAGAIAIEGSNLYVFDFGMVVGEELTLVKLYKAIGPPSVHSTPLDSLTARTSRFARGVELEIKGGVTITATFPKCFVSDNESVPSVIATAIGRASASK